MDVLRDSVDTAVTLGLFPSREEASAAHLFNSKVEKIPLSAFQRVENFNPARAGTPTFAPSSFTRKKFKPAPRWTPFGS